MLCFAHDRPVVLGLAVTTALLSAVMVSASSAHTGKGCTIRGTSQSDVLHGTSRNDIICTGGGSDRIFGGQGNDRIFAGRGNDRIFAGEGNDRIAAGRGDDRIAGGANDDRLDGGGGNDQLFGGRGKDRYRGGPGDDSYDDDPPKGLRGGPPKAGPDYGVSMHTDWNVPLNTRVTFRPLGSGNCAKNEQNRSSIVDNSTPEGVFMLTAKGGDGPWDSCFYALSNDWFRLTFRTPSGTTRSSDINVQQLVGAPGFTRRWEIQCGATDPGLTCQSGGVDSSSDCSSCRPNPSVRFTLTEDKPPPPSPAYVQCAGGTYNASVGDSLNNLHLCTSGGWPLPDLKYSWAETGRPQKPGLPDGITASRYPTDNDTWIVLNGRLRQPGDYTFGVVATQGDWSNFGLAYIHVTP